MPPLPQELPELVELQRLADSVPRAHVGVELACEVEHLGARLPVFCLTLGNPDRRLPAVGYFGGVHGLERIGSRVVIAWLHSLVMRLHWDVALHATLERLRVVFMPLVNPAGMARGTRANAAGVDLMRNAPVEAEAAVPPLVGGQRLSARLPWYRGPAGHAMQAESAALCSVVQRELHGRSFSLALDCHSGFGMRDRIWFPYACRRAPFEHLAQLHALHQIFLQTHTHHPYMFEPQSRHYLAHGDLWDHLHRLSRVHPASVFLPLTLEMGSWLWVKKNPRQLFTRSGMFNPLIAHRERRVLRRHMPLLDFAMRAAAGAQHWLPDASGGQHHLARALALWYPQWARA